MHAANELVKYPGVIGETNFGEQEGLASYFSLWLTEGPMFGRETSSPFMNPGRRKAASFSGCL